MRNCRDAGQLLHLQQEWVLGSLRRLTAVFSELATAALDLSRSTTEHMGYQTAAMAEELARAGREVLSAAGANR